MGKKKNDPQPLQVEEYQDYADFENSNPQPQPEYERRNTVREPTSAGRSEFMTTIKPSGHAANLEIDTQTALLRTFENFYQQESETLITTLEESRDDIKNSMLELCMEQERYKEELLAISDGKYNFRRKKENSIPLSEYIRRKKGLAAKMDQPQQEEEETFRSRKNKKKNLEGNPTLLAQQKLEREAIEKYLRKRDRQKQAEENRKDRETGDNDIQAETNKILTKMKDLDMNKEKERERQTEKIQARLKNKNKAGEKEKDDEEKANEILEKYHDQQMAYEREKRAQQQKIQARLTVAREKSAMIPSVDI